MPGRSARQTNERHDVDVKIGVQNAARELTVDVDQAQEQVVTAFRDALASDDGVLVLADQRGGVLAVPAAKIAYLEFGSEGLRKVGFGA